MSESKLVRPPQVTVAGWLVVAGSVVVVLMAFDQVSTLRSLETREAVADYLSKPPGDALGVGVQGALSFLRVTAMVAAACAAATAILGWQVLQRSRGARIALSSLAVPLFLSGLAGGGVVVSAVVVAAIVMLWFQPARDWFDGIATAPAPAPPPRREPTGDPLLDLPPPTAPPLHPTPYAAAPVTAVAGRTAVRPATARPRPVLIACILTWVFSAAAFGLLAITLAAMLAAPDTLLEELHRQNPDLADQGVTDALLRTTVYVSSAVVMAWSAAAIALAVLTWRRVRWAAIGVMVSAGIAGGLCLLVVVGAVFVAVPLAACCVTVALLLRAESRAWFADPL